MSSMKYYTNIVPTSLYSKLLEKGMPVNLVTYTEVFDWLMTKGISIYIIPEEKRSFCFYPDKGSINADDLGRYTCYGKRNNVPVNAESWIESANTAIRETIEQLI